MSAVPPPVSGLAPTKPRRVGIIAWVLSTYFAEGFPAQIVRWLSGIYFTDIGMKEAFIGRANWLGFPWLFKFLWAPLVDLWSTKRRWLLAIEGALCVLCALLAGVSSFAPKGQGAASQPIEKLSWADLASAVDPTTGLSHQTVVIIMIAIISVMALLSATHDIAIDAYYLEAIPTPVDQALYSSLRVLGFRIAVIVVRSAMIFFSVWYWNFLVGAGILGVLFLGHLLFLPKTTKTVKTGTGFQEFLNSFATYLQQPRIILILAFIVTYKLGDELLFALNSTFLMRELAVTKPQMSWLSGVIGMTTTIAGTTLGSLWIKRVGFKRAIWPLTILMNINIWVYVWLAWARPLATDPTGLIIISFAHGYENMAKGLGDAAFLVFLLYTCKPEHKAGHYAIGSAIVGFGSIAIGGFVGDAVEAMGYTNFYIASFLASVPGMILLPFLPIDEMIKRREAA